MKITEFQGEKGFKNLLVQDLYLMKKENGIADGELLGSVPRLSFISETLMLSSGPGMIRCSRGIKINDKPKGKFEGKASRQAPYLMVC